MKKIEFKNKVFEYSLIGCIILLLCWNLYTLTTGNLKSLISITFQGILLFLIFSKNKYAKIGIKIWAIILFLSHGISFLAILIKSFLGDEILITQLFNKASFLILGIFIYVSNEKYIDITK